MHFIENAKLTILIDKIIGALVAKSPINGHIDSENEFLIWLDENDVK